MRSTCCRTWFLVHELHGAAMVHVVVLCSRLVLLLLGLLSLFSWRGANGLCLLEYYFSPSRLSVVARHDGSYWVILLGWLARWAINCFGVVFLNDDFFGVCGCGFTLALFCSVNIEVACFDFAGGKRTSPNEMPFVRSCSSCLTPRDLFVGGGKWTVPNGMPNSSSFDVPLHFCGFVSNFLVARGCEMSPLRIRLVL